MILANTAVLARQAVVEIQPISESDAPVQQAKVILR
jgi:hypothetical protein